MPWETTQAPIGAVELAGFEDDEPAESATLRPAAGSASDGGPVGEPRILPELESTLLPAVARQGTGRSGLPGGVSLAELMAEDEGGVVPAAAQLQDEVIGPSMEIPLDVSGAEFGGPMVDSGVPRYQYDWDGVDYGECSGCSSCNPGVLGCTPCGPWGRHWVRVQYLLWWMKGMPLPPLVTSSPGSTPAGDAGVLGLSTTDVLYGNGDALDRARSGLRVQAGMWFDPCQWWGWEVDLFGLERKSDDFALSSEGNPVLARPFDNALLNVQDAELVAYPGVASGTVAVHADSRLYWAALRTRINLWCVDGLPHPALACTGCDPCGGAVCAPPGGYRLDLLIGLRYLRLNESLQVREQLTSTLGENVSSFDLLDSFDTGNRCYGIEAGLSWEVYRGPWSLELLGLLDLGNTRRTVQIDGRTTSSALGVSFTDPGGLLALSSNIGYYKDHEFVVIPELGATIGYAIAPNLRLLLGYSVLYWRKVVRPGEQIDLRVNPNLLPPEQPTSGALAPGFVLSDTNFWRKG